MPKLKRKRRSRYPWNDWFKKEKFILVLGRDFNIQTHGMANMVRNQATSRAIKVSLSIVEETRIEVTVLSNIETSHE